MPDDKKTKSTDESAKLLKDFPGIGGDEYIRLHLAKQEKVTLLLEKREGEYPELPVTINGCQFVIMRGEPCSVPKQVAELVYERMASEGKLAQISQEMMSRFEQAGLK